MVAGSKRDWRSRLYRKVNVCMFIIDDILLAPVKGLAAICRKVHEQAEQEQENEEKAILASLAELHQLLEAGQISEQEFSPRESALLDQLEERQNVINPGLDQAEQELGD